MRKTFIAAALACLPLAAVLASTPATAAGLQTLSPETAGSGLSPEARERLKDLARRIAASSEEAVAVGTQKHGEKTAKIARRADDIADEALQADRDEALRLIGIDPEAGSALYYFVSWSMPLEMLRTYALEAMWTGGTLIFKGIPPGKDLKTFFTEDLQSLVYGKGSHASISVDPRLYDSYNIQTVPTLVLTEDRANPLCIGERRTFKYGKELLSFPSCPKLAEDKYWKISGAVTSNYALLEFKAFGSESAKAHLSALAKGLAVGLATTKTAAPYAGPWKDAISPADIAAVAAARAALSKVQQQPAPPPLK